MQIFARITKVDEATGKVYGRAVQEVVDRSGEIFDYESSKPNFVKWSEAAALATEGKSVGNLRAMHGKVAAGKLTEIDFVDAEKAIDIVAEVVDPVEREKCVKGVYTGFSIGGRYAGPKWEDAVHKGVQRYTADPSEISLVDLPCVPTAQFTVVKADGSEELRKFEATTDSFEAMQKWAESLDDEGQAMLRKLFQNDPATASAELEKRFAAIADIVQNVEKIARRKDTNPAEGEDKYGDVKYADPKNKKYPIDTEKHIRAAWSYIHMPKNAAKYSDDDVKEIKSRIKAAWKDVIGGEPDEAEKMIAAMTDRLAKHAGATPCASAIAALIGYEPALEKGLWTVSSFAEVLDRLSCIADSSECEAQWEGDDSPVPAQLRAALRPLAEAFLAMAHEEVVEAIKPATAVLEVVELADKGDLAKAMGFDDHNEALKKWRDVFTELNKVQGELTKAQAELVTAAAESAAAQASLTKVTTERDDAKSKLEKVTELYAEMAKRAEPPKGAQRVVPVEKTMGITEQQPDNDDEPVKKADGSIDHVATAEKQMRKIYKR